MNKTKTRVAQINDKSYRKGSQWWAIKCWENNLTLQKRFIKITLH